MFPAVSLADFGSMLNAWGLTGFMWHWPKHQGFMLGVTNCGYAAACGNTLIFILALNAFHIQLGWGVFSWAVLVLFMACLSYIIAPEKAEYWRYATAALLQEQAQDEMDYREKSTCRSQGKKTSRVEAKRREIKYATT